MQQIVESVGWMSMDVWSSICSGGGVWSAHVGDQVVVAEVVANMLCVSTLSSRVGLYIAYDLLLAFGCCKSGRRSSMVSFANSKNSYAKTRDPHPNLRNPKGIINNI